LPISVSVISRKAAPSFDAWRLLLTAQSFGRLAERIRSASILSGDSLQLRVWHSGEAYFADDLLHHTSLEAEWGAKSMMVVPLRRNRSVSVFSLS